MEDIERLLLNYDDLPASERAAVDAHLDAHPEAEAALAEGRAVRALLEDAARAGAPVPDAESLARYLASQHAAGTHALPPDLVALGERIEAALGEHPELERRYAMMQDRLKALTRGGESPRTQFERLTGHRLGQEPAAAGHPPQREPADLAPGPAPEPDSQPERSRSWRPSVTDRRAVPLLRRVSLPRFALAASLLAGLLYGGLFLASQSSVSPTERLAGLSEVSAEFEGLRLRGSDGPVNPVMDRYAEALATLRAARSSTLGLFASYDPNGLREAAALLEEAASLGEPDGPMTLEAWFLVGKIRLHQGNVEAAREALQTVVDRRGPSAPDAQRLLDALVGETP